MVADVPLLVTQQRESGGGRGRDCSLRMISTVGWKCLHLLVAWGVLISGNSLPSPLLRGSNSPTTTLPGLPGSRGLSTTTTSMCSSTSANPAPSKKKTKRYTFAYYVSAPGGL